MPENKPKFANIIKSRAAFQSSTVLMNDTVVTMNNSAAFMGGFDNIFGEYPQNNQIVNY